jgi:hypothetical protein
MGLTIAEDAIAECAKTVPIAAATAVAPICNPPAPAGTGSPAWHLA